MWHSSSSSSNSSTGFFQQRSGTLAHLQIPKTSTHAQFKSRQPSNSTYTRTHTSTHVHTSPVHTYSCSARYAHAHTFESVFDSTVLLRFHSLFSRIFIYCLEVGTCSSPFSQIFTKKKKRKIQKRERDLQKKTIYLRILRLRK